ncbi:bifunctional phosphoglucose/phosphomannose isomerase [Candidatus Daviesbacteria bacterium]|nr:bifunctional phosphoglucose/phosphomannose isomerase [Candidatus Daviesbacteria bacterium]
MNNLDPKNVLGSVEMFLDQCEQIWQEAKNVQFPDHYRQIKNIVICGMGGSAFGGYVVSSLYKDQLKVPFISNNDYSLPGFVSENTLVILLSYSGTTEEVLSCLEEAKGRRVLISGITIGGKLGDFFQENKVPTLRFNPRFNPSGQPRLAPGYMVLGLIGILNKLGMVSVSDEEVRRAISEVKENQESIKSAAKNLAKKIYGSIPVIFAAEFLSGNAYIIRNQTNETAKSFASYSLLSELNHHLMEGLKNPPDKKLFVLFLNTDLYSDKLSKRVELTKDVVGKNGVGWSEYQPSGSSKLSQVLNVLSFGGFLTYDLAMLYGQDPSVIPWVDYFKERLENN